VRALAVRERLPERPALAAGIEWQRQALGPVARVALDGAVLARQRPGRVVVAEQRRRLPGVLAVARAAVVAEHALVRVLVARPAVGLEADEAARTVLARRQLRDRRDAVHGVVAV